MVILTKENNLGPYFLPVIYSTSLFLQSEVADSPVSSHLFSLMGKNCYFASSKEMFKHKLRKLLKYFNLQCYKNARYYLHDLYY